MNETGVRTKLEKVSCYKCGASLEEASTLIITENPFASVVHTTCSECSSQSMVTITPSGAGIVPLVSDLEPEEVKRFLKMDLISYDEILELHKELKGIDVCKLMQKKEKSSVKRSKESEQIEKSPQ